MRITSNSIAKENNFTQPSFVCFPQRGGLRAYSVKFKCFHVVGSRIFVCSGPKVKLNSSYYFGANRVNDFLSRFHLVRIEVFLNSSLWLTMQCK